MMLEKSSKKDVYEFVYFVLLRDGKPCLGGSKQPHDLLTAVPAAAHLQLPPGFQHASLLHHAAAAAGRWWS